MFDTHPGGAYILQVTRGTDCTSLFETHHVAEFPRRRLETYRTGTVSTPLPGWDPRGVHRDLRDDVASYSSINGSKLTDHPLGFIVFVMTMVAHAGFVTLWMTGTPGLSTSVGMGITLWLGAAEAVHSGTHGAISHHRWVNAAFAAMGMLFCPPFAWVRQHVTGHHGGVNTSRDPDVYHHPRRTHGWRVLPSQPYHRAYSQWRVSLALGLWLTQLVPSILHAGVVLFWERYPGTREPVIWATLERPRAAAKYFILLAIHAYQVWRVGVLWAELPFMLCGACFYGCSQVSHINGPSGRTETDRDGWAVQQLRASSGDYATTSTLAGWLSIGLNNQAVHHVFPSIHHVHYGKISKLLRTRLRRAGVQVSRPYSMYGQALGAHLRYLQRLNDPP